MKVEEIIKHCEQAKEKFRETRLLPTSSYYMGYHDMAAEILEIIEATEKNKGIEKLNYYYKNTYGRISQHKASEIDIVDKINEIISCLESRDKE